MYQGDGTHIKPSAKKQKHDYTYEKWEDVFFNFSELTVQI